MNNYNDYRELPPRDRNMEKICLLLLVDVSISMTERLPAVSKEINRLIQKIQDHDIASKMVEISVETFSDDVKTVMGWRSIVDAGTVSLSPEGGTALNNGLMTGYEYIRKRTHEHRRAGIGDRRSQFFLITDGYGDNISSAANKIKERTKEGKLLFWALGVGEYDKKTIAELTDGKRVYELKDDTSNDYSEFFDKVVAASVIAVSESNLGQKPSWSNPINDPNSTLQKPDLDDWLEN